MKNTLTCAAAALFAMSTMASAASFTLDLSGLDGIDGTLDDAPFSSIPNGLEGQQAVATANAVLEGLSGEIPNTFLDAGLQSLNGYQGAQVLFSGGKRVRVSLLGWEAGFFNSFELDGQRVGKGLNGISNATEVVAGSVSTPLDSFVTGVLGAGVLDFSFDSAGSSTSAVDSKGGADNGTNPIIGQNFFVSCGGTASTSCSELYVFYDDGQVAGDNHDDLVLVLSTVPVPAGGVLLMTGLGALALRRRRKSA